MYSCVVLVFFYSLLSLPALAQALEDKSAEHPSHNDSHSQGNRSTHSGVADTRVSVTRLKVPPKARQLYEKAMEAWGKQNFDDAQRRVDQALKIDPAFPEVLTLRAFMQASVHQWDSAEESLQRAIRSDPNYSPAYVILAGIYNEQKRYAEAQQAARQALSAGANTWSVQYEIARTLIGKGEYQDALKVIEAALRSQHGSLLHVAKAHALLGLRRYTEAATELTGYLHDEPSGEGSRDARYILERLQKVAVR